MSAQKGKAKSGAKAKTPAKSAAAKKLVTKKGSVKKAAPPKKGAKKSPATKATKGKSPVSWDLSAPVCSAYIRVEPLLTPKTLWISGKRSMLLVGLS